MTGEPIPVWWHACGIMLVITIYLLSRSTRSAPVLVVCITRLPGVFLHELSHLLAGTLLRADPVDFSLMPQRRADGRWTLGSVAFRRVNAFNAVPVAFAPIGLVPLAVCLYSCWFDWLPATLENTLLLYAALFILVCNALPSRQDVRVACNWKSLLLYGGVSGVGGFIWMQFCA